MRTPLPAAEAQRWFLEGTAEGTAEGAVISKSGKKFGHCKRKLMDPSLGWQKVCPAEPGSPVVFVSLLVWP